MNYKSLTFTGLILVIPLCEIFHCTCDVDNSPIGFYFIE